MVKGKRFATCKVERSKIAKARAILIVTSNPTKLASKISLTNWKGIFKEIFEINRNINNIFQIVEWGNYGLLHD